MIDGPTISPNLVELKLLQQKWRSLRVAPKGPMQAMMGIIWEHYESAAKEWDGYFAEIEGEWDEMPESEGEIPCEELERGKCVHCGSCFPGMVQSMSINTSSEPLLL